YIGPLAGTRWPGRPANFNSPVTQAPSFKQPLFYATNFINDKFVQRIGTGGRPDLTVNGPIDGQYPQTPRNFIPGWSLTITNRLRIIMQDANVGAGGRLIDYVQLGGVAQMSGPDSFEDINRDLHLETFVPKNATGLSPDPTSGLYSLWTTNAYRTNNNTPRGIWNQLWIAQNSNAVANAMWGSLQFSVPNAVANFTGWLGSNGSSLPYHVPFVAFAKYTNTFTWSANDPLVHYMASDLSDLTSYTMANNLMVSTNVTTASLDPLGAALTPANLL